MNEDQQIFLDNDFQVKKKNKRITEKIYQKLSTKMINKIVYNEI